MESRPISTLQPNISARSGAHRDKHDVAVRRMFDRISPTYDLVNRVLSLGIDRGWRLSAIERLAEGAVQGPLMDLCAGTLDLSALLTTRFPGRRQLVAVDFARNMLVQGRDKIGDRTGLVVADAARLPFRDDVMGGVICGFGVRNVGNTRQCLEEVYRTLRPGASAVFLEFFRPRMKRTQVFHGGYARFVMPTMGRALSQDEEAYQYLVRSMNGFYSRYEFEELMRDVGFRGVGAQELTMGVASIVYGHKPSTR